MSPRRSIVLLLAPALAAGCAARPQKPSTTGPLAELRNVRPDLQEATVEQGLEQVAIAELELRSRRLEDYEVRARYAMADSYDRATAAQQQAKVE